MDLPGDLLERSAKESARLLALYFFERRHRGSVFTTVVRNYFPAGSLHHDYRLMPAAAAAP